MLSFGVVAMTTILASIIGFFSYDRIETASLKMTEDSVPAMAAALQLVEEGSALTNLASTIAASSDVDDHAEMAPQIASHREDMDWLIEGLAASESAADQIETLTTLTGDLFGALGNLDQRVGKRLAMAAQMREAIEEIDRNHDELIAWLIPKIDDAKFDLVIQSEETTSSLGSQIETLMTDGVGGLQSALTMKAEINLMAGILIEAIVAPNRGVLEEAADRFVATKASIDEQLAQLSGQNNVAALQEPLAALINLGEGPEGIFTKRRTWFENSAASTERNLGTDVAAWTKKIYEPREAVLVVLEGMIDEASFDIIILSESAVEDGSNTINSLVDQSVATMNGYLGMAAEANWLAGLLRQVSAEQNADRLVVIDEQIDAAIARLLDYRDMLEVSKDTSAELDQLLQPMLMRTDGPQSMSALRLIELDLLEKQQSSVELTGDLASILTEAVDELVGSTYADVLVRSESVQQAITTGRWILVGLSAAALMIAAAVVFAYVGPRIINPLRAMTKSVGQLAQGRHVDVPGTTRNDELGELARSLNVIHERAVEATRIRLALDSADASVMVTDADQKIIYVNARLNKMLSDAESDIKREIPAFATDRLMGASVEFVHKQPEAIRDVLEHLDESHHESMNLGGRDLSFIANPVIGADGKRLGSVLQWQDETDERKLRQAIDEVVEAAGAGDFTKRVETAGIRGTMADLAGGINHVTGLVEGATQDLGSMLASLAKGNLTQRITAEYQGTLGELKDNANQTADQLAEIVSQIQGATRAVGDAAAEISSGTADLSNRTNQAATNLQETAASTEQMAATVQQNAENARSADQLAASANKTADAGGDIVKQAVMAMSGIEGSAKKITDIISVIDEIAFQTNLLALNASVEAARAGETGKGFAVVAQEVRQLAQRSAQAASDINTLIQNSNGQVEEGVRLVNQAGESLGDIVGSIRKVASIVRKISSASQEQASGVQGINNSVTNMENMTQQNAALVKESTASASALNDQAGKLTELMAFFKIDQANSTDRHQLEISSTATGSSLSKVM